MEMFGDLTGEQNAHDKAAGLISKAWLNERLSSQVVLWHNGRKYYDAQIRCLS